MSDSPANRPAFTIDVANRVLEQHFAAWVRSLDIAVVDVDANGASVRMRFGDALCREGGIVSGQALAALADTAMVIAIASASGGYRPMATVDLHTTFMRPVSGQDVVARADVDRIGRTLAFARVAMRGVGRDAAAGPAVASAVGTFALG